MDVIRTVIIGFLLLEATNVLALYFMPESKFANSIGVFNAWEKSKQDPEVHNLVKYLVNWVAGAKLIFIMLLLVILLTGDEESLVFTSIALVLSIASFFWRLFPLIRQMDKENQITPHNYSTGLGWMIFAFILIFFVAFVVAIVR